MSSRVTSLDYDGEKWVADVEGSYDYTVIVEMSDDAEIINTYCDCPYDMGVFCKHQVAVFHALKNRQGGKATTPEKPKKKKNLADVIGKLDKKTLVRIVLDMAGRHNHLRDELLLLYGEKTDLLQSSRKVIASAINSVKRRGFVDYDNAAYAVDGAERVLKMVDERTTAGDVETAVSLCIVCRTPVSGRRGA